MKNYLFSLFLLLSYIHTSNAQNYNGIISGSDSKLLAGATVYIEETKQGLVSNNNGRFQTSLEAGTYTMTYKYPDYKEIKQTIQITSGEIIITDNIILEKATIKNPSVRYHDEKKANTIIQNVISEAARYANSIRTYKGYSYIKGDVKLNEVSAIIDKISFRVENYHLSELKNKSIIQEIYNEIEYYHPDKYTITVKGYSGNIPRDFNNKGAMSLLAGSIYKERLNTFISPLNHNAFDYYRYKYEGFYDNGNCILHKIKVESKIKDAELLNGYLYITDNTWQIYYTSLTANTQGTQQTVFTTYENFGHNINLPVSYFSTISFNIFGTGGEARYYISLEYENISGNNSEIPLLITANDMPDDSEQEAILFDSQAYQQDEEYWNRVRVAPLASKDIVGDSIYFDKEKYKPSNFWLGKVLFGGYALGNDTSKWQIKYSGVKEIFKDYNYVDGFWLGQKFGIKHQISRNRSLEITPYIYYITARNRLIGGGYMTYNYAPKRRGQLTISVGSRSADFNSLSVTRYQNYFMSLFFGENYNFLYQKDYAIINNRFNPTRWIRISTSVGIEKRSGLSNNTDFRIFNRNHIKQNIFPDDRFDQTFYSVGLSYSPSSFFNSGNLNSEIRDLERRNALAFHIEYHESFSSWQKNNSKYRKIKGGMMHNIQLDYFNRVDYKVEAGGFLGSKNDMHFADYQHFGASDLLINLNSLFDSFLLAGNYDLRTNRYWVNVFLNYSGKYFLIKRLPFLQGKPFYENIHLKTLYTPDNNLYNEFGYSLSLTRALGVGTFVSFDNMQCKNIGVRFSLNLRSLGFS